MGLASDIREAKRDANNLQYLRKTGAIQSDLPGFLVLNTEAATLPRFSVVELIGGALNSNTYTSYWMSNETIINARKPLTGAVKLAILTDRIPAGKIGRAEIAGILKAKVNVSSTSHEFATIANGSEVLVSAETGEFYLLNCTGTTGLQYAYVSLAGGSGGGLSLGLIAKTITKGHPVVYNELGGITTEAVEAVKLYTIIPDGTYNSWAANVDYTADTTITYNELYYTVLVAHRSTEAATPQTATHLYKQAEGVEAVIAGTEGHDMTLYMPYLPVGSKVSYKSSSDGYAVIIGTPTRVENEDERYSLYFDERVKRAKAVFA